MPSESPTRKALISKLPSRYRKAIEVVEASGGTVSDFALNLTVSAEKNNLADKDVIAILKKHYTSTNIADN
ncbi:MAG: hypothetical protein ABW094_01825 [Candidatus Thiodiazotropha sp.]